MILGGNVVTYFVLASDVLIIQSRGRTISTVPNNRMTYTGIRDLSRGRRRVVVEVDAGRPRRPGRTADRAGAGA
ncbi:hypothetical protein Raf01_47380 [Rugosimonospora africana]|uniref:Uncharacterized protein n=1 Tax=Rugosimonospora africana TaxID=556532 RepID=A0A8J3QXM5_9ACTN|nr:hypothetical protein Raf01_47380 [Rugosimonospora africana]